MQKARLHTAPARSGQAGPSSQRASRLSDQRLVITSSRLAERGLMGRPRPFRLEEIRRNDGLKEGTCGPPLGPARLRAALLGLLPAFPGLDNHDDADRLRPPPAAASFRKRVKSGRWWRCLGPPTTISN